MLLSSRSSLPSEETREKGLLKLALWQTHTQSSGLSLKEVSLSPGFAAGAEWELRGTKGCRGEGGRVAHVRSQGMFHRLWLVQHGAPGEGESLLVKAHTSF